jgi:DNA-binding LytR/AlgR family response regulator
MYNCIIIDDEAIARQILEQYIAKTPTLTLLASCRNALEGFAKLEQHHVDLIFLDIEMPLVSGLHFLKTLETPPQVILTTAYPEHAFEAFELNVADYLLKPFSPERFAKAIAKLKPLVEKSLEEASLLIREKGGTVKIPQSAILYLKGSKDYVKIITETKTYLVSRSMKSLEEELPALEFTRIHKSYIVGLRHVRMVKASELVIHNQEVLPVSPNYKERLLELYSK